MACLLKLTRGTFKRGFPLASTVHSWVLTFAPLLGFFCLNYSCFFTAVAHLKLHVCTGLMGATLGEPARRSPLQDDDLEREVLGVSMRAWKHSDR